MPTMLAFIYGVTSWYLMKKFRNFRNYVILSAILANLIRLLVVELCMILVSEDVIIQFPVVRVVPISLTMYSTLSFNCWLLVLCYYFYIDLVQVFYIDIQKKYLKSGLFAWGLPLISSVIYFVAALYCYVYNSSEIVSEYMFQALTMTILTIPVIINFVIYILVVHSLYRGCEAAATTCSNKWCRFYIATLIFVLSNVLQLTAIAEIFDLKIFIIVVIGELGVYLNTIALDVFIIIVKSNRRLWREFLKRRSVNNWNGTEYFLRQL